MANLNYAEQWSPELLEILMQGTLTSPFVTSNVRWLDAKTFHFTQMSTSGYKNHNRKGGWNTGTYDQKDIPYTLTHDRDVEFMVDKADVDETNATASIQNISRVFEQTWVVPETDALFFSKVAQAAQNTEVYHGSTATSAYTKAKVFGMLKAILAKGKLRRYKAQGSLIMYVRSEIMDAQNAFQIQANLVADILNTIQNLYQLANKREIAKIQDEFYRIYKAEDLDQLRRFQKQLDVIAEGYRAQSC